MRFGIDLGGTKTEIIALGDDGKAVLRRRVPSPQGDYRATLENIARLLAEAECELGIKGSVGIGTPGAISPTSGLLKNSNSTWLNGRPFDRDLAALLQRPVRLQNDANCFALSEATDGAGAGQEIVFGVILGTGVGGGIVVRGQLLTGHYAISGEWGHNPLPYPKDDERPGPDCYCGRQGCIETFLSGPAIAKEYRCLSGEEKSAQEIARAAEAGDKTAQGMLARFIDRLARSLAGVINILDPDAIVLGGGLSSLEPIYRELPQRLPRYVFSDSCQTPILPPVHGDSSGVRGAAWLWRPEEVAKALPA